jgi:AraC-like DNA-binding protein
MKYRFYSYVPQQMLAANGKIDFSYMENKVLVIEALSELTLIQSGQSYEIRPGALILAEGLEIANPGPEVGYFRFMAFDGGEKRPEGPRPARVVLDRDKPEFILIRQIVNYPIYRKRDIEEAEKLFDEVCLAVTETERIGNGMPSSLHGPIDPRLLIVNRYIRKNYHQPLCLQYLSDLIGCHPVYLSNMYAKVFKVGPMQHLQRIRMQIAKRLVADPHTPIKEIARSLGYVTSSQFGAVYKKYYGTTPHKNRINEMSEGTAI